MYAVNSVVLTSTQRLKLPDSGRTASGNAVILVPRQGLGCFERCRIELIGMNPRR
jgi:hypothetical protein